VTWSELPRWIDKSGTSLILPMVTGIIYTAFAFWRGYSASKAARAASEDLAFEIALHSRELELIGAYLTEKLGSAPLKAYLLDDVARERLDTCLKSLAQEVNQPEPTDFEPPSKTPPPRPVSSEEWPPARRRTVEEKRRRRESGNPAMKLARQWLAEGKVWDAMAVLRRALEESIYQTSPKAPHPLQPNTFKDPSMRGALGVFLRTANAVIHGKSVDIEAAQQAARAAAFIFERLDESGFVDLRDPPPRP